MESPQPNVRAPQNCAEIKFTALSSVDGVGIPGSRLISTLMITWLK